MNNKRIAPVTIQNAKIIFRNFAGRKGPYNEEGERSFTLVLPEPVAKRMMMDGWNVKEKAPFNADEGAEPEYHLQVNVEYRKGRPPRCVLINANGRTELGAEEVAVIDYAELENVDLSITPYQWEVGEKTGVKAYLKTIFVTVVVDELDLKYAQIPEARPAENLDMFDNDEDSVA